MRGMAAAPAAELAELDPVGRVPLRLRRLIVAPLAVVTGKGDRNSHSSLGHVESRSLRWMGCVRACWRTAPGPTQCSGTGRPRALRKGQLRPTEGASCLRADDWRRSATRGRWIAVDSGGWARTTDLRVMSPAL